jgi:hypothetical protein
VRVVQAQTSAPQIASSRSRAAISLLLAAVVLGLGIFFLIWILGDDLNGGGRLEPPSDRSEATAPVDLNKPFSWGLIYLRNQGDDPVHVEALDLGQIPTGLRVLGSYAVPGNARIGLMPGYAQSRGRPVVGLTIPPKATYNAVVGLSATARGRHMIPEVIVRYKRRSEVRRDVQRGGCRKWTTRKDALRPCRAISEPRLARAGSRNALRKGGALKPKYSKTSRGGMGAGLLG